MDGNRTHPGRLSSAPQTVLKTAGLASTTVRKRPLQFGATDGIPQSLAFVHHGSRPWLSFSAVSGEGGVVDYHAWRSCSSLASTVRGRLVSMSYSSASLSSIPQRKAHFDDSSGDEWDSNAPIGAGNGDG